MRLRRRWIVGLVVAPIAVVAIAYGYLAWSTKDAPPHAALQPHDTASGAGRVDPDSIVGRWTIVEGSGFVGYRIRERLGPVTAPSDAVGRSTAVTGTAVLEEPTRLTASRPECRHDRARQRRGQSRHAPANFRP